MNINFLLSILVLLSMSTVVCFSQPQFPMSNDESFDSNISAPTYKAGNGPRVLIDGGHNNFFVQFISEEKFHRSFIIVVMALLENI